MRIHKPVFFFVVAFAIMASSLINAEKQKSFGDYPAPDDMYAEIRALETRFPENAKIIEYGKSVLGRPLLAVRISSDLSSSKPAAAIAANIHGNEWIGNRVAMAAAVRLLEGANDRDEWISSILSKMDFYVLPCLNPDGYYKTYDAMTDSTIPSRNARKNSNKVDINRNFPLPAERSVKIDMAGSDDPDHERYTGPSPYSEPESRAVRDFFTAHPVFASVDLHSNWATIFPPKCNSSACEKQFKKMCDAAIARQKYTKYACVMQRHVDSFSGEMEDTMFYDFGAMSVCWEIFTTGAGTEQQERLGHFFWGSNPEDIGRWVDNDRDAVIAALEEAYNLTGGKPIPENFRQVEKQ